MKKLSLLLAIVVLAASPTANASTTVKYVNQKAGQFCKKIDIGKFVLTPSSEKLQCLMAKGSNRVDGQTRKVLISVPSYVANSSKE